MNLSKHRQAAFIFAGVILLGGALLLTFPALEAPTEPQAEVEAASPASETAEPPPPTLHSDYGGMLLKLVISVALVCLLAYAILRWGLNRVVGGRETDGHMQVLSRLGVGPNRSIMVVRVGPRFLVIGTTETGISLLSELSEEEANTFLSAQPPDKTS